MKLSHWAKSQGISYRTAWRMWKDGTLPTSARQLPTGTIIVDDPKSPREGSVALYVRVSKFLKMSVVTKRSNLLKMC